MFAGVVASVLLGFFGKKCLNDKAKEDEEKPVEEAAEPEADGARSAAEVEAVEVEPEVIEVVKEDAKVNYVIQASSASFSGNSARITINDLPVQMEKNEDDNARGLHIVVINPDTGNVE